MTEEDLTEAEYKLMLIDLKRYGFGSIDNHTEREDRAFLIYEVTKYEKSHNMPLTAPVELYEAEVAWWHNGMGRE